MNIPWRKDPKPSKFDKPVDELIAELAGLMGDAEEYAKTVQNLRVLMEAKSLEPKPNTISAETWAIIGGNLAGIIAILSFEKANVLTSKALSMILRPKM